MARRSVPFIRHRARVAMVSVGFAAFFGAIAGGRALLLPAAPMTWIVDDDGGPGVHFTDIQPALDAAVDGDLVLVHPGTYSAFTLVESLSILGLPGGNGVNVPFGNVSGVAGDASVADINFQAFDATGCTGTLVLDSLLLRWQGIASQSPVLLTIQDCADVRVIAADAAAAGGPPAADIDDSTVELVSCILAGTDGQDPEVDGGVALRLQNSRAYISRSTLWGGDGGDDLGYGCGDAGDGGNALEVLTGGGSGSDVLLIGTVSDWVKGGDGGDVRFNIGYCGYGGDGGDGVLVKKSSAVRFSNVTVKGGAKGSDPNGASSKGKAWVISFGGSKQQATPPDPALERTAAVQVGGIASVKLTTQPGAFSRLFVGSIPIVKPTPNVFVDSLVVKEVTYSLGNAPASGVIDASFPLDPSWTQGTVVYAQAMSIFPGGEIRRTNSVPFVVR